MGFLRRTVELVLFAIVDSFQVIFASREKCSEDCKTTKPHHLLDNLHAYILYFDSNWLAVVRQALLDYSHILRWVLMRNLDENGRMTLRQTMKNTILLSNVWRAMLNPSEFHWLISWSRSLPHSGRLSLTLFDSTPSHTATSLIRAGIMVAVVTCWICVYDKSQLFRGRTQMYSKKNLHTYILVSYWWFVDEFSMFQPFIILWLTFRSFLACQKAMGSKIQRFWHPVAVGVLDEFKQIWQRVRELESRPLHWECKMSQVMHAYWQDLVNSFVSPWNYPKTLPIWGSGRWYDPHGTSYFFGVNSHQLHTAQRHQVENKSHSMTGTSGE